MDLDDIKDYLMFPVYWCRSGKRRLKRLIAWFPVIWNDEDWDSAYLYEIMRFKISRIRKEMTKNKRHKSWDRDVKNMIVAEELLKRAGFSDFYWDNPKIYKPLCKCDFADTYLDEWEEDEKDNRYKKWRNPFCEHCRKYGFKKEDKKEKDDFNYCMDLIKNKSQRWWD